MINKIVLIILSFFVFSGEIVLAKDVIEIKFDTLPDSVKQTAATYTDKQKITKITRITDNGHITFNIESDKTENSKNIITQEILISNSGKVMKLTQEVPYFALSFEQMQEIENRYPNIKVDEVKSIQVHYFDVVGQVNNKPIKFRILENSEIDEAQADKN